MVYRALASMLVVAAALAAAAQEAPSRTPPRPPDLADLGALTAAELARAYLAATATLPLAQSAGEGLGLLNLEIDGRPYRIDAANAAQFIALLEGRVEVYGRAIAERGTAMIDGTYTLSAGPGCTGEKFDPRSVFAAALATDGTPLVPTTASITQSGIDTNLLVTLSRGRERLAELLYGATVGNTVVFTKAMGNGFGLYGTVKDHGIEVALDPEEVKRALGEEAGTDADWQAVEICRFSLTPR
jgi:hypothetical protein